MRQWQIQMLVPWRFGIYTLSLHTVATLGTNTEPGHIYSLCVQYNNNIPATRGSWGQYIRYYKVLNGSN